jgi:nitrite reductase (NO-forming)
MTATTTDPTAAATAPDPAPRLLRRLHGAAVVRVLFGVVWAIDATFKWLPGFIHGQKLGAAEDVHTPVIHQWLSMWHDIGTANPSAFAIGTAIVETLIAVGLILGAFANLVLLGSAVFSFGIWSAAEGFHLPWHQGMTDLGPSVGYKPPWPSTTRPPARRGASTPASGPVSARASPARPRPTCSADPTTSRS